MRFRVGSRVYRVKVKAGLVGDDGAALAGLCDNNQRVIWLAVEIPAQRRREVLIHELRHAWQHAMGRPADEEGDARQVATFVEDVCDQLLRQGGEWALMRLSADGVVDHAAPVDAPGEPRAAQCPACSGLLNMPIRQGAPEYSPRLNRLVVTRAADCEFCGHTVHWQEAVTSHGAPTGQVVSEPRCGGTPGLVHPRGCAAAIAGAAVD